MYIKGGVPGRRSSVCKQACSWRTSKCASTTCSCTPGGKGVCERVCVCVCERERERDRERERQSERETERERERRERGVAQMREYDLQLYTCHRFTPV